MVYDTGVKSFETCRINSTPFWAEVAFNAVVSFQQQKLRPRGATFGLGCFSDFFWPPWWGSCWLFYYGKGGKRHSSGVFFRMKNITSYVMFIKDIFNLQFFVKSAPSGCLWNRFLGLHSQLKEQKPKSLLLLPDPSTGNTLNSQNALVSVYYYCYMVLDTFAVV